MSRSTTYVDRICPQEGGRRFFVGTAYGGLSEKVVGCRVMEQNIIDRVRYRDM